MPEHIFDDTRAKVANFLIQNSGNFQFSTSIESDALTFSFHSTPFSPLTSSDESPSLPSLSYSPVQWDELSDDPGGPFVVDANGLGPAFTPQFCAGSQDSVAGTIVNEALPRQLSLSGSHTDDVGGGSIGGEGEFFHDSNQVQQLTKTMPIPMTHHPPHGTKTPGNADENLPNVYLLPDGTHIPASHLTLCPLELLLIMSLLTTALVLPTSLNLTMSLLIMAFILPTSLHLIMSLFTMTLIVPTSLNLTMSLLTTALILPMSLHLIMSLLITAFILPMSFNLTMSLLTTALILPTSLILTMSLLSTALILTIHPLPLITMIHLISLLYSLPPMNLTLLPTLLLLLTQILTSTLKL
ncbi:hypothetical protein EV702DRAFT_1193733 [Suillus placidus]|uniref:Uncharacterized protein n=1 Tax=Suillus placidus TaxID=48579 RepID=A0A9P7D665_9AGAM|nr:hypothetical protein EV702DRAFT_1193733 [Suillus placidus]